MLTEFLKSIRGEKALWETIITGVDVCNFRLQGNTKDPFIPISLQPLHFEVFFCFSMDCLPLAKPRLIFFAEKSFSFLGI